MEDGPFYPIALSLIPGLKPASIRLLLDYFGSAKAVFAKENLEQVEELNPKIKETIRQGAALKLAEKQLMLVEKNKLQIRFIDDENYPHRLRSCPDAPILLYSKGYSDLNTRKILSVVGTRHATAYGRNLTENLVRDLAEAFPETLIVSGLAYGIDITAHKVALANQLNTAAVLAHGLQEIYPVSHRDFASKMISNGSLITEMPWGTPSEPFRFLQRNRIVAGMCDACVVVESAEKGGSLITARMTADYGRDVFAFSGRKCDEQSRGCNLLIKSHIAGLIESAEDLFREMNWEVSRNQKQKQMQLFPVLNAMEEKLYNFMKAGVNYRCNDLSIDTNLSIGEILAVLMQLEMAGLIVALPGGTYLKKDA